MSLHVITGCMFSGKTTELIHRAIAYKNQKILIINHSLDNRYGDNVLSSHDLLQLNCLPVSNLESIKTLEFDVLLIDEAQFFKNLKSHVMYFVETLGKHVVVAGLTVDANRDLFGELHSLIPYADTVTLKTAICMSCKKKAIFSKKINSTTNSVIDVGNTNKYIAVCRDHYLRH